MRIRFIELDAALREGGLEKAAADMAHYLNESGVEVVRGDLPDNSIDDFDLVHFHGLWSPAHYRISGYCRDKGIPVVVSPHGMLEPWAWRHRWWKKWPYFNLFEKRRLNRSDALLATATQEAENLRKFFPRQKIEILPLGVETTIEPRYEAARRELGWGTDEKVLLYLSRVHPKKGLKELLESLKILSTEMGLGSVRLVIVGDGPAHYLATCREWAAQLAPHMKIDWVPPQWGEKKWPYLQGADLFCLPTYSENFGIVVLEAGLVGTPVFTTTGTPWKCIADAGYGYVVDPDPANYPLVLREFLADEGRNQTDQRSGFADWTREHYGWPSLVQHYLTFFKSLCGTGT